MTDPSEALRTALDYHEAWTANDIERAMTHLADDFVCEAPAGPVAGLDRYRQFLGGFAQTVRGVEMIAAFGDEQTALLMYDCRTTRADSVPTAECFTVSAGKIRRTRLIFDRTPFAAPPP